MRSFAPFALVTLLLWGSACGPSALVDAPLAPANVQVTVHPLEYGSEEQQMTVSWEPPPAVATAPVTGFRVWTVLEPDLPPFPADWRSATVRATEGIAGVAAVAGEQDGPAAWSAPVVLPPLPLEVPNKVTGWRQRRGETLRIEWDPPPTSPRRPVEGYVFFQEYREEASTSRTWIDLPADTPLSTRFILAAFNAAGNGEGIYVTIAP